MTTVAGGTFQSIGAKLCAVENPEVVMFPTWPLPAIKPSAAFIHYRGPFLRSPLSVVERNLYPRQCRFPSGVPVVRWHRHHQSEPHGTGSYMTLKRKRKSATQ